MYFRRPNRRSKLVDIGNHLNNMLWGIIIIVIDIGYSSITNGTGFYFDFVNDLIGAYLIYNAVSYFSAIPSKKASYRGYLNFTFIAAVVCILNAILDFFIVNGQKLLTEFQDINSLILCCGLVTFCLAMTNLSEDLSLSKSAKRWEISMKMIVLIYLVPLIGSFIIQLFTTLYVQPPIDYIYDGNWQNNTIIIPLILLLFTPFLYLIYTIKKMIFDLNKIDL